MRARVLGVLVVAGAMMTTAPLAHAAAPEGTAYAFGANYSDQLGSTTGFHAVTGLTTPTAIAMPTGAAPVRQVSTSLSHTLIVTTDGQVYALGANSYGELGTTDGVGTAAGQPVPAPVTLPGATGGVVEAAAGLHRSAALTSTGEVYGWGNYDGSRSGAGANTHTTPVQLTFPNLIGRIIQIAGGDDHVLAVTNNGELYEFGEFFRGDGGPAVSNGLHTPTEVTMPGTVAQAAVGTFFSMVRLTDGDVYSFGDNSSGQLGVATNAGTTNDNQTPQKVPIGEPAAQIAAGVTHALVVGGSGAVYAFGSNSSGQLGNSINNTPVSVNPTPAAVPLPAGHGKAIDAVAGVDSSAALTNTGEVLTWGNNVAGELGRAANAGVDAANPTPGPAAFPDGVRIGGVHEGSSSQSVIAVSGSGVVVVTGTVLDRNGKAAPSVTVKLNGTDDQGAPVALSVKTDAAGRYTLVAAPGTYNVQATGDPTDQNGGALTSATCPNTATGDTCPLGHLAASDQRSADFTWTACAATDRHPNDKPLTGCPVIFVPGFLGTRIACEGKELWPGLPQPDFGNMLLLDNGFLNASGSCNFVAGAIAGRGGLVTTVAGQNIYQGAETFLDGIAPGRVTIFTYDWRRSPTAALVDLAQTVADVKKSTDASHVTIVAHSMGGLVTRAYVADPTHAENVARVLTLGTPYWGAPKSHFALLEGDTDTPEIGLGSALDVVTSAKNLQRFAGNSLGLFSLYPSPSQTGWLTVQSYGALPQNAAGVDRWVKSLGATPEVLDRAQDFHRGLDTLDTNGIDYEVMIGTGVPTVSHITILNRTPTVLAGLQYASGDGTVPAYSASMGAIPTGLPSQAHVAVHQACEVGHVVLPATPSVQVRIKDYILKGTPVGGGDADNCFVTGEEFKTFKVKLAAGNARASAAPAGTQTLRQALAAGQIQVYTVGGQQTIVMDKRNPVKLALSGGVAVEARAITAKGFGPTVQYAPVGGTLVLDPSGRVARNGKALKAAKVDHKAPHTTAKLTRRGKKYLVKLTARDASGVGATSTQIGKAQPRRYTKPITVTKAQLKALRFSSVDAFGNVEKSQRAR